MSTVRTNNVQVGQSLTATNNFTLYQPTVPDGTVRLGVGNTGATTLDAVTVNSAGNVAVPSLTVNSNNISAVNSLGFRNRLINGGMGIWQRGTSGFSAFNAYTADRWAIQNCTSAAQSSDTPSSAFQFSIEYANSSASFPLILQRIESVNARDLVGQQVTLSFWAKNVSGSSILYCELYYPTASDNFSSITLIQSITAASSPSSSWTFYTLTFNALPSQVANGLEVRIVRNNASAATTRATGVQLEAGSVATPFERRDYGRELMMCQRYYSKSYALGTTPGSAVNPGAFMHPYTSLTGNILRQTIPFKVSMRAAPTVTIYGGNTGASGFWQIEGAGTTNQAVAGVTFISEMNALVFSTNNPAVGHYFFNYTAEIEL